MGIDIVNIIEDSLNTTLIGNYQSRIVDKIKNSFNDYEQKLFLSILHCNINYDSTNEYIIDLDNVWKWLGFSQKARCKELLEKNFILNKDYNISFIKNVNQGIKQRGGHNKETIMMNINTFKKLCLKSGTKKADEIHDYFIKLQDIMFEVLKEESEELTEQLQQIKIGIDNKETTILNEYNEKLLKEKALEKHSLLLREFGCAGALVYILKVKSYSNGQYVIKIGESRRGVEDRYNEHKSKYEEALLLDCFIVHRSRDFEKFLHHHEDICPSKVTNLEGHENEKELFLVGHKLSYRTILNIIKNNIQNFKYDSKYNEKEYNDMLEDIKSIKYSLLYNVNTDRNGNVVENIFENNEIILQKITNLEKTNKEILEKLNSSQTRTTTNFETPLPTIGPRLQKINPETFQLIKVYETVTECMKEDNTIKRPSIHKAIEENIVYKGFRWMYVDRELDPNIVNIKPTKITKSQNLGYIAKLNNSKTEILNIYIDRKTAAIQNGYASTSSLDNPVKNGTITNNHYYMLFDNCDYNLKEKYIKKHGEPILYKCGVGQYDRQNNLVIEFTCKYDCIKKLSISDKTLAKTLDKNVLYNGFYYKSLSPKLSQ